jgi:hypothetical protein
MERHRQQVSAMAVQLDPGRRHEAFQGHLRLELRDLTVRERATRLLKKNFVCRTC